MCVKDFFLYIHICKRIFFIYIIILKDYFEYKYNIYKEFSSLSLSHIYIYIYIYISKLATVVKAPFFNSYYTPRCRGGCYSFPWIAPLYP